MNLEAPFLLQVIDKKHQNLLGFILAHAFTTNVQTVGMMLLLSSFSCLCVPTHGAEVELLRLIQNGYSLAAIF